MVDPDPTVSKVVGAVGIVHGADVFMTSWNQLPTGQTQDTVTSQTVAALARQLGLDPKTAATVGAVVDIAVPTGVATAVARSQMIVRLASVNRVRAGLHQADCPRIEVDAVLSLNADDLEAAYETSLRSSYWPGGDGLTVRQWLQLLQNFLMASPDTSRDHRSGAF